MMSNLQRDTLCVQAGYTPKTGESRIPQICQSTTFFYGDTQQMADLFDLKAEGFFYTRLANPTVEALEKRVAALEGGAYGIGCASGMSAILLTAMTLCRAGDNIVRAKCTAAPSTSSARRSPSSASSAGCSTSTTPKRRSLPSSTTRRDLFMRRRSQTPSLPCSTLKSSPPSPFIVDNTLATPVLCRPGELGANIVIHSTSKYIDGHAAALGGMIVDIANFDYKGNPRYPDFNTPDESYHGLVYADEKVPFGTKCRAQMIRDTGAIMSPQNAFLTYLGCDTLALRMERHCSNAKKVAAFLNSHPKIEWVRHPSLEHDRYHALAEKYLPMGTGGMMSFGIRGDAHDCARFMEHLKLITQETHVADVRSCVLHPASTTHRQLSDEDLKKAGIPANLVRLSVGIENPDDIIADLTQALAEV